MREMYLLFIYFVLINCSNISESKRLKDDTGDSNTSVKQKEYQNYNNSTFVFSNDSLRQTLDIKVKSEREVEFLYTSRNIKRNLIFSLKGVANLSEKEDLESDVDDQGNGYFVDEYVYRKDCSIVFRIDADEFRRSTITTHNCTLNNTNISAPITGIGMMKRIK